MGTTYFIFISRYNATMETKGCDWQNGNVILCTFFIQVWQFQ